MRFAPNPNLKIASNKNNALLKASGKLFRNFQHKSEWISNHFYNVYVFYWISLVNFNNYKTFTEKQKFLPIKIQITAILILVSWILRIECTLGIFISCWIIWILGNSIHPLGFLRICEWIQKRHNWIPSKLLPSSISSSLIQSVID